MEQANWEETYTTLQKHTEEISKSCKVDFVSIYISSNSLAKTESIVDNREDDRKYFLS